MANDGDGGALPAAEGKHVRAVASGDTGVGTATSADRPGSLSAHTRDRIAGQLRAMYETVTQQAVPDRFAELIAKLDANDRG